MEEKRCPNKVLTMDGIQVYCDTVMIEVPLFNSVELVCPSCQPSHIPDIQRRDKTMKDKCGYKNPSDEETKIIKPRHPPAFTNDSDTSYTSSNAGIIEVDWADPLMGDKDGGQTN